MTDTDIMRHPALWLVPAGMCLLAIVPLPYAYYILLRIVVCTCAVLVAFANKEKDKAPIWFYSFLGVAVLFNPLIPIYLERELWFIVDIAVAVLFVASYSKMRE